MITKLERDDEQTQQYRELCDSILETVQILADRSNHYFRLLRDLEFAHGNCQFVDHRGATCYSAAMYNSHGVQCCERHTHMRGMSITHPNTTELTTAETCLSYYNVDEPFLNVNAEFNNLERRRNDRFVRGNYERMEDLRPIGEAIARPVPVEHNINATLREATARLLTAPTPGFVEERNHLDDALLVAFGTDREPTGVN